MDYQGEVGLFFEKLRRWREESEKEFINFIQCHSSSISKGINGLVEEVSDLKVQLSLIKIERDDLIETVHNLCNDNRHRSAELPSPLPLPGNKEIHSLDAISPKSEDEHNKKHNTQVSTISSETGEQDDITFNECVDSYIAQHPRDEEATNDMDNHRQEVPQKNNRKETTLNSTPRKSIQSKSKFSKNTVHNDNFCPECKDAFSTRAILEIHLKNIHPKNILINEKESIQRKRNKKLKCEQCHYTSTHLGHVKQHIKAVHKNIRDHVCEECGYAASEKNALTKHIKAVHENIRNHICGECGHAFVQKIHLKNHVEGVHEKSMNHVCEKCGYAASHKVNLKQHIKAVHENIKNHVCTECGYAASEKSTLKHHTKAVHENIKNHVCRECGYAAYKKSTLKRHTEAVHENMKNHVISGHM